MAAYHSMSNRSCGSFAASVRMRCARLLSEMSLSLWGRPIPPSQELGVLEHLSFKKCSRHCPAIAQALGLLSSRALPSCATDRLSARDGEEINHRVQAAPRPLSARCETFDNQQRKDVKAKQHWCPLKQDHPKPLPQIAIGWEDSSACALFSQMRRLAEGTPTYFLLPLTSANSPRSVAQSLITFFADRRAVSDCGIPA